MGEKQPFSKRRMSLPSIIYIFSRSQEFGLQIQFFLLFGKLFLSKLVRPLKRKVWPSPEKIGLLDEAVHLHTEIIINNRESRLCIALVGGFDPLDNIYGFHGTDSLEEEFASSRRGYCMHIYLWF